MQHLVVLGGGAVLGLEQRPDVVEEVSAGLAMGVGVQDIGLGGGGGHRFLLVELVQDEVQAEGTRLHAVAVGLEALLALGRRGGQQRPNLGQRHLQLAHARDQQRRRRLVAAVRR